MPSFRHEYDPLPDSNLMRSSSANILEKNSSRNPNQRPQSYNDIVSYGQSFRPTNQPNRRNSLAKLNDFRKKVHQVIDLCTNQSSDTKGNLSQVINEERKVYDLLMQNPSVLRRTTSHQNFPQAGIHMQQTIPYNQSYGQNQSQSGQSQRPQQIKTPFRPQKIQNVPQSHYYIPNQSQVGPKQNINPQNISYSNVNRPESGYLPQSFQSAQFGLQTGGFNAAQNLQSSFLKLKSDKQIHLNDDTLRLIEEIERKASNEIERLRKQKLELMQRLNQQIKNVNEQRRKTAELQNILSKFTNQSPEGFGVGQNTQYFQAQINRLESQLQRTNEINQNLRLELGNRGAGVPGIEELLRQGESIRQQTLRLLKLKQQGDSGSLRIQELERRLATEQAEKQASLNEIRSLRERLGGASQARTYEQNVPTEKSIARSRPSQQVKSVGQYEDLVSEMKRITGF